MALANGSRGLQRAITGLVLLGIGAGTGFVGGVAANQAGLLPDSPAVGDDAVAPPAFTVFWEAWEHVQERYVDRVALDPQRQTYGAVEGLVESLGDTGHSRFLTPSEWQVEATELSGWLEGVGAQVAERDGAILIVAPLPDSPAERAGIRAGDTIVRVDGEDVEGLDLGEVVSRVRGPSGTTVSLTVLHRGESTLTTVTITRDRIEVPAVTWARLPETTVADVQLSQFSEGASDSLITALKEARAAGATSIILDLRNNPGGLRDEAVRVASQFIGSGLILQERDASGRVTPYPARPGGVALDVPLVVLVNQGTASSGEIVAGAIKDHQRAPLVGATTFGTGTVLSVFRLSDGSALLLGTAEWLTPSGSVIWHNGVQPHVAVELTGSAQPLTPREASALTAAALRASEDTQLVRALDELRPTARR